MGDARTAHVALLRGVNVGGKNRLPMADLAAIFTDAGAHDVVTYVQSGNVVFRATSSEAPRATERVSETIERRFGFRVPIVLRDAARLRATIERNPFLIDGISSERLHVMFLADAPSPAAIAALDPKRSSGDAFVAVGDAIYLHLPHGVADSKLTNAYFDSKLATTSTSRNWKTVLRLAEVANA